METMIALNWANEENVYCLAASISFSVFFFLSFPRIRSITSWERLRSWLWAIFLPSGATREVMMCRWVLSVSWWA